MVTAAVLAVGLVAALESVDASMAPLHLALAHALVAAIQWGDSYVYLSGREAQQKIG